MKSAVIFTRSSSYTRTKAVEAIAEVDEFGAPFALEVLWMKARVGDEDSARLIATLKEEGISCGYSEEVDALTITFGDGLRSWGQGSGTLEISFDGDTLVGLKLLGREEAFGSAPAKMR